MPFELQALIPNAQASTQAQGPQVAHIPPALGASPLGIINVDLLEIMCAIEGRVPLSDEQVAQLNALNAVYSKLPMSIDSERSRLYVQHTPVPELTPAYYPQVESATNIYISTCRLYQVLMPHADSYEFYTLLATDTLFFIFYYMEGTLAQQLAARALKSKSWRFHKKYLMWFQRFEEPKVYCCLLLILGVCR